MSRFRIIAAAVIAVAAALAGTAVGPPDTAADDCTYNQAIAGCVDIQIVFVLPGSLEASAYDAIYTDPATGTRYSALCASTGAQIVCQIDGIARFTTVPEYYTDANGNLCRHILDDSRTAVIDIECHGPIEPEPSTTTVPSTPIAVPVPSFTG